MEDVKKFNSHGRKIIPDIAREVKSDMNANIRLVISFVCTKLVFKLHSRVLMKEIIRHPSHRIRGSAAHTSHHGLSER